MSDAALPDKIAVGHAPAAGLIRRALDSDIFYSFRRSRLTMVAAIITLLFFALAIAAPLIAVQNPFDPSELQLMNSRIAPLWTADGQSPFLLGTDEQGRDVLSAILYGLRISLVVGILGVILSGALGIALGLIAGYFGGAIDALIMRIADVQLTFPAILTALLVDGVIGAALPKDLHTDLQLYVMIFAIGISVWPGFARTIRGSTLVERNKDYVMAARVIGLSSTRVMLTHVLPNVIGPVLVIGTLALGNAILTEATLSFLGVGLPPTEPSLGTLIRIGNDFLFSGEWWVTIYPGIALVLMVLSINLLGDWLRDALNPRLR